MTRKMHHRNIRLYNNAGMNFPTCYVGASLLASSNPRFDRERFLKACGVQS